MTLPTKEEAKRAAETLDRARGAVMFNGRAHDAFDLAITLLKAYAAGELVEREPKFDHFSATTEAPTDGATAAAHVTALLNAYASLPQDSDVEVAEVCTNLRKLRMNIEADE